MLGECCCFVLHKLVHCGLQNKYVFEHQFIKRWDACIQCLYRYWHISKFKFFLSNLIVCTQTGSAIPVIFQHSKGILMPFLHWATTRKGSSWVQVMLIMASSKAAFWLTGTVLHQAVKANVILGWLTSPFSRCVHSRSCLLFRCWTKLDKLELQHV